MSETATLPLAKKLYGMYLIELAGAQTLALPIGQTELILILCLSATLAPPGKITLALATVVELTLSIIIVLMRVFAVTVLAPVVQYFE